MCCYFIILSVEQEIKLYVPLSPVQRFWYKRLLTKDITMLRGVLQSSSSTIINTDMNNNSDNTNNTSDNNNTYNITENNTVIPRDEEISEDFAVEGMFLCMFLRDFLLISCRI